MTSYTSTVGIIGGGFAGVITATKLALVSSTPIRIVIIGNEAQLGRGIAYSTTNSNHLVNGPAKSFGIVPEQPLHLVEWLRNNAARHGWTLPEGVGYEDAFPSRWVYGSYVQETFQEALQQSQGRVSVEHLQARATGVIRMNGQYQISTDREVVRADALVLATGLQLSAGLSLEGPTEASRDKLVSQLWDKNAWNQVAADKRVLVIGSGLTALDSLISAEDAGFQGEYVVLSRRGLLVQTRAEVETWPCVLDVNELPKTLAEAVRHAQKARRQIRREGGHRQQLTGALRPHLPAIWKQASLEDKARFIRYLRPYWENNLHRAAPESGKRLDAITNAGRLQRKVGQLGKLELEASGQVRVTWRPRGTDESLSFLVDRVFDAHGYEFDWHKSSDPLLIGLLANGLVQRHPLGFGIRAESATGQVLVDGKPVVGLYAVGHPLRGESWESNSVGEQVPQAVNAAKALASQLQALQQQVLEPAL